MVSSPKQIAVLGSTGSIGRSTLEVIAAHAEFSAIALTAHSSAGLLAQQASEVQPRWVVLTDPHQSPPPDLPRGVQLLRGPEGVQQVAAAAETDMVVAAIVGSAGVEGTWAALEAGKPVALANKETMVMAGPLVTRLAAERGAPLLPVDSEHSAIFQCLKSESANKIRRVILTASGGPFRNHSLQELADVTVEQALAHPTWDMGPKITVDSATMMNKALEIVEARWLFDLEPEQIDVVVHPQSVVHSMVEFVDGAVIAQLSPPDMKLPIQYALSWPERLSGVARKMDWTKAWNLEFEPPDFDRFPALRLGLEVARTGGTSGAVVNAANEAAVAKFLAGEMSFVDIVPACQDVLNHHHFDAQPTLTRLFELDRWARQEVTRWVCT